jgi:polyphosphate kinase
MFEVIRRGDVLLHHPFQSFAPVIDFLRQAAPTRRCWRSSRRCTAPGPIHRSSKRCSRRRAGKDVTVVIELRARFDEEANIELATRLQEAGAHVVYGIVGYKTHAKMRWSCGARAEGMRRYVHLGTGNYHPRTARLLHRLRPVHLRPGPSARTCTRCSCS